MKNIILVVSVILFSTNMFSQNSSENQINEKDFCVYIGHVCDMTSKELASMKVKEKNFMGNLWDYKFLNKFDMYHNAILPPAESVFIDFSTVQGVNQQLLTNLLDKCVHITKTKSGYTYNKKNVKLKLVTDNNLNLLHFDYQF